MYKEHPGRQNPCMYDYLPLFLSVDDRSECGKSEDMQINNVVNSEMIKVSELH